MKKHLLIAFMAILTIDTFAQCDTTNAVYNSIISKYEQLYKEIEPDTTKGPWSKSPEIGWAGEIDVRMVNKKIIYDLVAVTMRNKKISFNTPQVTMRQKKMSFSFVETTMENQTVGYKPEFKCCPPKTWMSPIITKVPVVRTVTKSFSTDIPEFRYQTTSIITKIPEFKNDRKEIILKLPEVTVITASSYARTQEEKAQKIKEQYETLSNEQKKEITNAIISTFECHKNSIIDKRSSVQHEFTNAISEIDRSIENVKAIGADPSNLTSEDGSKINLIQLRNDLLIQMGDALKAFDDAITQLIEREKQIVENL